MKKLWLVAVAGFALSTSAAFAADLGQPYYKAPPPPVVAPNWAGVYIGVNRGYGWNRETGDLFCEQPPCLGTTGGILKPEGGLAGGQIGYNWQSSIVVYGIEADIQWADIHDSASGVSAGPRFFLGTDTYDASAKRFGTVRGRLGITPLGQQRAALCHRRSDLRWGERLVVSDDLRGKSRACGMTWAPRICFLRSWEHHRSGRRTSTSRAPSSAPASTIISLGAAGRLSKRASDRVATETSNTEPYTP